MKQTLLFMFALASYGLMQATVEFCGKKSKAACKDRTTCQTCYCSFKCGPRQKKADDTLIYVENDPNGIFCYCKQRDLDYYEKNGCKAIEESRQ